MTSSFYDGAGHRLPDAPLQTHPTYASQAYADTRAMRHPSFTAFQDGPEAELDEDTLNAPLTIFFLGLSNWFIPETVDLVPALT